MPERGTSFFQIDEAELGTGADFSGSDDFFGQREFAGQRSAEFADYADFGAGTK
jgi:hypothetical protein